MLMEHSPQLKPCHDGKVKRGRNYTMALQPSVNVRPGLCLPIFEIALSIQGRHATGAGAGNGLAVDVILDVASRKDAGHTGCRSLSTHTATRNNIAILHG